MQDVLQICDLVDIFAIPINQLLGETMFADNEARERIEMLEREMVLLRNELRNSMYLSISPVSASVRDAVVKLLEHMKLIVVYRPGETVLVKKEE